jgi:putative endonuclease
MDRQFYVYILASVSRNLYIGFTSDLEKRVWEHKTKAMSGFSEKYNVNRLVHYEEFARADDGIAREKQLKRWSRAKKVRLIEQGNPGWADLSYPLFRWEPGEIASARETLQAERDAGR